VFSGPIFSNRISFPPDSSRKLRLHPKILRLDRIVVLFRREPFTVPRMITAKNVPSSPSSIILPAILTGGLAAGIIDGASAFLSFGWRMPLGIASGLLGSKAFPAAGGGGPAIWCLGLALHFAVALGAAATYCLASRRFGFLRDNFLLGGVICGIAVFLGMNLVVLPLSVVPFPIGPFSVGALRNGLGFHVILVGLPISTSLWYFARRAKTLCAARKLD
jgi:hypothetical protein